MSKSAAIVTINASTAHALLTMATLHADSRSEKRTVNELREAIRAAKASPAPAAVTAQPELPVGESPQ